MRKFAVIRVLDERTMRGGELIGSFSVIHIDMGERYSTFRSLVSLAYKEEMEEHLALHIVMPLVTFLFR